MKQSVQPLTVRHHRLNIRLDEKEWDKLHKFSANSTCRSVSEYARKVLLEKPVRVFYRNQSFDDFEETMVRVLSQLETIGENFAMLVKKTPPPDKFPELQPLLSPLLECAQSFTLTAKEIRTHVKKLADQCDQKSEHHKIKSDLCDQK